MKNEFDYEYNKLMLKTYRITFFSLISFEVLLIILGFVINLKIFESYNSGNVPEGFLLATGVVVCVGAINVAMKITDVIAQMQSCDLKMQIINKLILSSTDNKTQLK